MTLTAASVLCVLLAQTPAAPAPPRVESAVKALVERWNVPGVAVAIVKDGAVVLERGYGVREAGAAPRVDEHTAFYLASVTKTFTVTALGILAEEGKLRIDDPVTKHLPAFAVADADTSRLATLRDLAAHRTGLPRADLLLFAGLSPAEVMRRLGALPSIAPLRARFTYQNQMYLALGEVVAALGQATWSAFVESRILTKVGMTDANARGLGGIVAGGASPHAIVDGAAVPLPIVPRPPTGAGGINASAHDLAKWLQFQLGDGTSQGAKIVGPQVLQAMQQPNAISSPNLWTPDATFLLYGLGWFLSDYHGRKVVQHPGNGEGWTSLVWMIPGEKLGIAVATNLHNTLLPWAIAHEVADLYNGAPRRDWAEHFLRAEQARDAATRPAPPASTAALDAAQWVGAWEHPVYGRVSIETVGGETILDYGPNLSARLEPGATPTQAVARWTRRDLLATLGPSAARRLARGGPVLALTLGGETIEFVKVQ